MTRRLKRGHPAIRPSVVGWVAAAAATLAVALVTACAGPGSGPRAAAGARALVSDTESRNLVSCTMAPDYRSTGIISWHTPIAFALDSYYNRSRRPLTIESVALIDPHNVVLHGALLYEIPPSRHPLIMETAWDTLGRYARPGAWAARQAVPGAVIPAPRPAAGQGQPARDLYQLVLDISGRTSRGGWAAGEIVRYRTGGQLHTVTTYTGYAIAAPPSSAPSWCDSQGSSIRRVWAKSK